MLALDPKEEYVHVELQEQVAVIYPIKEWSKSIPNPPKSGNITVSIDKFLEWLMSPTETITASGYVGRRNITVEIATALRDNNSFAGVGHIEVDGSNHYLWKLDEWKKEEHVINTRKDQMRVQNEADRARLEARGMLKDTIMSSFGVSETQASELLGRLLADKVKSKSTLLALGVSEELLNKL
jgi:hypothetical protein